MILKIKRFLKLELNKFIIIPCKDEKENIKNILHGISKSLKEDTEIIIIVDDDNDSTLKIFQ